MDLEYYKFSTLSAFQRSLYTISLFSMLEEKHAETCSFDEWTERLFEKDGELKPGNEIIICEDNTFVVGVLIKEKEGKEKIYIIPEYACKGLDTVMKWMCRGGNIDA